MVNGKTAKASYDVKVGDVIEIQYGNKTTKFVVNMIKEHVTKDEASEMYTVIS
jgi:ribosomal 50S subunit-recycling heat shock protein